MIHNEAIRRRIKYGFIKRTANLKSFFKMKRYVRIGLSAAMLGSMLVVPSVTAQGIETKAIQERKTEDEVSLVSSKLQVGQTPTNFQIETPEDSKSTHYK